MALEELRQMDVVLNERLAGLNLGDTLIADPIDGLEDGRKVRIKGESPVGF